MLFRWLLNFDQLIEQYKITSNHKGSFKSLALKQQYRIKS